MRCIARQGIHKNLQEGMHHFIGRSNHLSLNMELDASVRRMSDLVKTMRL